MTSARGRNRKSQPSSPERNIDLITTNGPDYLYENPRTHLRRCNIQEEYKTRNNRIESSKKDSITLPVSPPPPSQHRPAWKRFLLACDFYQGGKESQG